MKVSLNWLKEFVVIPNISAEQLAAEINEHCFEVEKIIRHTGKSLSFSNVYVAKVLEWQKHPNADRLRVVKLDLGGGRIISPVVCGAHNFEAGDNVALALPGAFIPQDIHSEAHESYTLSAAKIRGIESQGMVCSAFELGLAPEPEQKPEILVLPKDAKQGIDLKTYLSGKNNRSDIVFDLALPANRPDLYSHLGIARELSGVLGYKLTKAALAWNSASISKLKTSKRLALKIKNKKDCPYYVAIRAKVRVSKSPDFIRDRLEALGLRSVNNVVDITNYVMYELGEPLHAFDAKFVEGEIVVRSAESGEKIVTLDHKQRELTKEMLVIADSKKALAVAGIMGGVESEISSTTAEIILEAANFEPTQIRKTSKALGLRTDGSVMWEKGLKPEQAQSGAVRAFQLLSEFAGASIIGFSAVGTDKTASGLLTFSVEDINELLGTELSSRQIKKHLKSLGVAAAGANKIKASPPYYRKDLQNYTDIAEEILRILGMNNIEKKQIAAFRQSLESNAGKRLYEFKQQMVDLGFNEVQNYSFISEKDRQVLHSAADQLIKVKNPLSADQQFLRKNLLAAMLKNAALNQKNFDNFKLFETGFGYGGFLNEQPLGSFLIYDRLVDEQNLFARAKGVLENLIIKYFGEKLVFKRAQSKLLAYHQGQLIASIEAVMPITLQEYAIENPIVFAEIYLNELLSANIQKTYHEYSRFPNKVIDLSIVVPKSTEWQQISDLVQHAGGDLLQQTELFDAPYLYSKNSVPKFHRDLLEKGLKNLAFHMVFGSSERTLKDSEISPIYAKIIGELKSKLGAEIR